MAAKHNLNNSTNEAESKNFGVVGQNTEKGSDYRR